MPGGAARAVRVLLFALLPWLLPGLGAPPAARAAAPFPSVWLAPAPASPDLLDMFRRPELWARTRPQIQVFHFSPAQLDGRHALVANDLSDLAAVDAFRKLRGWGMQTAIGAPAVKGWDCAGRKTQADTVREIGNLARAGGRVDWVTMDEPLAAGIGANKRSGCRLGIDTVAAEVAAYVQGVSASPEVLAAGPAPRFVDIEAYPATGIDQIEQFVAALDAHGFRPAGFFLDIAFRFVERKPEIHARMAEDLRTLRDFLHARHIAFGVVFWSGWDPVGSDEAYYARVIKWARFVHAALGHADADVFSSWVRRCDGRNAGGDLACTRTNLGCAPSDRFCGQKSVPVNLPDNDPEIFSHTRLIAESLRILHGP